MGEVISLVRELSPLEEARRLIEGIPGILRTVDIKNPDSAVLLDVLAEQIAEAHDIVQDYIEHREQQR